MSENLTYICEIGCTITLPSDKNASEGIFVCLDNLGFKECLDCDNCADGISIDENGKIKPSLFCFFSEYMRSHRDFTENHICSCKSDSNLSISEPNHHTITENTPIDALYPLVSEPDLRMSEPLEVNQKGLEVNLAAVRSEVADDVLARRELIANAIAAQKISTKKDTADDLETGESQVGQSCEDKNVITCANQNENTELTSKKSPGWEPYEDELVFTCASPSEAVRIMMACPDNRRNKRAIEQRWDKHRREGRLLLVGDYAEIINVQSNHYDEIGIIKSFNDDHTHAKILFDNEDELETFLIADIRRWDE